jgi:O-antigen/teichoic acid export membrane protein
MIKLKLFKLDGHMQEVLKGASAALMIRIFGTLLGFLLSVMIARLLGAEGSGVYFLALSVVTIASTVGRVGFDNTVVRFIAAYASENDKEGIHFVYRTAVKVVLLSSSLVTIIVFFGAEWIANILFEKPFMKVPIAVISIAIIPLALAMIQSECLRGLKNIAASELIKTVILSFVTLACMYPFIKFLNVTGVVAAYTVASVVTALVAWVLWKKFGVNEKMLHASLKERPLKPLFESSWPLFTVAVTGLVMQQAATVFLGAWGSIEDVGVFNIANRISALLLFPLMAMTSILTPKFAAMYRQGDMKALENLARKSSGMLMILSFPTAVFIGIYSEWILTLFGSEFAEGALILRILLVGVVVNAATGAVGNILMMSGNEKSVRSVTVIAAVLTVIMLFICVPVWEGVGAAVAVTIGISVQNLLMIWYVYKRLGFMPCTLRRI